MRHRENLAVASFTAFVVGVVLMHANTPVLTWTGFTLVCATALTTVWLLHRGA